MLTRGKVVLFYPPYDGPPLGAPLSLLALAGTLREASFHVVLIDAAADDASISIILAERRFTARNVDEYRIVRRMGADVCFYCL